MRRSVDILRERFDVDEVGFAFPYGCPHRGYAGAELVMSARRTDVICGLTTEAVTVDPFGDPFGG